MAYGYDGYGNPVLLTQESYGDKYPNKRFLYVYDENDNTFVVKETINLTTAKDKSKTINGVTLTALNENDDDVINDPSELRLWIKSYNKERK